jgi:hypothetical protein
MSKHCECQHVGRLPPGFASMYDPVNELPFVNHKPGKCKCTNNLRHYKCSDGEVRLLCSCCNLIDDMELGS